MTSERAVDRPLRRPGVAVLLPRYYVRPPGPGTVRLSTIEWDDGKGDYDVSGLPRTLTVRTMAVNERHAIENAMDDVSDDVGFLIQGCEARAFRSGN